MLTLSGAKIAAASAARTRRLFTYWLLLAATALAVFGCTPATTQVATDGPADPAVRVAPVGYRSTVAPYTSLRPATPAPWRDRNGAVTPPPKQGR